MTIVKSKLEDLLSKKLSLVQEIVFKGVLEKVKNVINKINETKNKYLGLNIETIANATYGQSETKIRTFITNMLQYQSKKDYKVEDVLNVLSAVKDVQNR